MKENRMHSKPLFAVVAASLALAMQTAQARPCENSDPAVFVNLSVSGTTIVDPGETNLVGKGSPVRIIWIAPDPFVFRVNGIKFKNPGTQFSQGHTGGHAGNGSGPPEFPQYHWCNQNKGGQRHQYGIALFGPNGPATPIDPVIVNDGPR
jgi:hypothetical protein